VLETFLDRFACSVSATIRKRRVEGPSLTVGHFAGAVESRVATPDGAGQTAYQVERSDEGKPPLTVGRSELVRATGDAFGRALKGLIKPVDRELSLSTGRLPASPN